MTGWVEAGALEHLLDLVADIGDLPRRAGIGTRGEQADEAQLALEPAVGRIELDADIIHSDAAMNAAVHIGLDDHEDGRLAHEFADFRGLMASRENPQRRASVALDNNAIQFENTPPSGGFNSLFRHTVGSGSDQERSIEPGIQGFPNVQLHI